MEKVEKIAPKLAGQSNIPKIDGAIAPLAPNNNASGVTYFK